MAKIINKIINHCGECPYCDYNPDYGMQYDSGYDCKYDGSDLSRILDDSETKIISNIPIPTWCGLDDEI